MNIFALSALAHSEANTLFETKKVQKTYQALTENKNPAVPLAGSHQLRFDLSRHGYPVLGEMLYGAEKKEPADQISLRSLSLEFLEGTFSKKSASTNPQSRKSTFLRLVNRKSLIVPRRMNFAQPSMIPVNKKTTGAPPGHHLKRF